jgi:benzoyl-CoA reductase/2-hydroxyglutaryl-CoA dehydratase subunit BcrC/BadD/HgdB
MTEAHMSLADQLVQDVRTRPEKLKTKKEKGIKIIGYTGRSVPEELIYAAGAVPYLLCRGGEPEPPDATLPYVLRYLSPFARSQIGYHLLGLDPVIPILDLIVAQCGDCHMERLADLFEYFHLPIMRIGVPSDWGKEISFQYYSRGLKRVREKLEAITGKSISDEDLSESIQRMNRIRGLLRKIGQVRKAERPPIGGYDFIRLNHYSFYSDLGDLTQKLDDLFETLRSEPSPFPEGAPRILLAGHVIGTGDYVVPKLIEDLGGIVVTEFLDEGIREYLYEVKPDGDLMANLGKTYYLERTPPCIFQPSWNKRVDFIKGLIEDYHVDGVVWYQISFEEIYNMECSVLSKYMGEIEMPFLKLESSYEYSREAMGPLTTRVESFLESIKRRRSN